jgi:hypothetical protein
LYIEEGGSQSLSSRLNHPKCGKLTLKSGFSSYFSSSSPSFFSFFSFFAFFFFAPILNK